MPLAGGVDPAAWFGLPDDRSLWCELRQKPVAAEGSGREDVSIGQRHRRPSVLDGELPLDRAIRARRDNSVPSGGDQEAPSRTRPRTERMVADLFTPTDRPVGGEHHDAAGALVYNKKGSVGQWRDVRRLLEAHVPSHRLEIRVVLHYHRTTGTN